MTQSLTDLLARNGLVRPMSGRTLSAQRDDPGVIDVPPADVRYFACVLRSISTLTAVGIPGDAYEASFVRRQLELASGLAGSRDERITYDLRFIVNPHSHRPARGRITVALVCRICGCSELEAAEHARALQRLLEALFEEHWFELLAGNEVSALLDPFAVTHLQSLTRRAWLGRLDSLRWIERRPPVGFGRAAEEFTPDEPSPDAVVHVAPYLALPPSFDTLFRLLVSEPEPVAISIRLQPTSLRLDEGAFLEEQIARCERYTQVSLGQLSGDLSKLAPTLREQAMLYQQHQARMLFALKGGAVLMTIQVGSTKPVAPIAHAVGALVTLPGGGSPHALAGGYEVQDEDPSLIQAFRRLEMPIPSHVAIPPVAARLLHLFDPVEAAGVFRLPPASLEPLPGLTSERWRSAPPPGELPDTGHRLGVSIHRGVSELVHLPANARRGSTYVIGATGTGKTSLLTAWIVDAMRAGKGLSIIDPHGDLAADVLGKVPPDRVNDVIVLDPSDADRPVGLNLLECETEAQRHFIANEFVGIMSRLLRDEFGVEALAKFAGPVFFQHLRMNLLLAMSNPEDPGTLLEVHAIYNQKDYWRRWLPLKLADPLLDRWVQHVLPRTDYLRPDSDGMSMGSYVGSKFERFVPCCAGSSARNARPSISTRSWTRARSCSSISPADSGRRKTPASLEWSSWPSSWRPGWRGSPSLASGAGSSRYMSTSGRIWQREVSSRCSPKPANLD